MPTGRSIYKIPLVYDDPDFVTAIEPVLESRSDYKLFTDSDGVFTMLTAQAEEPDLTILDVLMPFEGGFTAARELKAEPELGKIPMFL